MIHRVIVVREHVSALQRRSEEGLAMLARARFQSAAFEFANIVGQARNRLRESSHCQSEQLWIESSGH